MQYNATIDRWIVYLTPSRFTIGYVLFCPISIFIIFS